MYNIDKTFLLCRQLSTFVPAVAYLISTVTAWVHVFLCLCVCVCVCVWGGGGGVACNQPAYKIDVSDVRLSTFWFPGSNLNTLLPIDLKLNRVVGRHFEKQDGRHGRHLKFRFRSLTRFEFETQQGGRAPPRLGCFRNWYHFEKQDGRHGLRLHILFRTLTRRCFS